MKANWNTYNTNAKNEVLSTFPSQAPYMNEIGCAYWQWADSYMTRFEQIPTADSIALASNLAVGYPEFYYWLNEFCNPDKVAGMSEANWALFKDVKMYYSKQTTDGNFEHLWLLEDPDNAGEDPLPSSLFNLDTLKKLVELGLTTPNIVGDDKDKTYEVDFTL